MCLAQGPQRSDAGEARTRGPSVSSQALYHWATALPTMRFKKYFHQMYVIVNYFTILAGNVQILPKLYNKNTMFKIALWLVSALL